MIKRFVFAGTNHDRSHKWPLTNNFGWRGESWNRAGLRRAWNSSWSLLWLLERLHCFFLLCTSSFTLCITEKDNTWDTHKKECILMQKQTQIFPTGKKKRYTETSRKLYTHSNVSYIWMQLMLNQLWTKTIEDAICIIHNPR